MNADVLDLAAARRRRAAELTQDLRQLGHRGSLPTDIAELHEIKRRTLRDLMAAPRRRA